MPKRAKRPCMYPGCPELVSRPYKYCEQHRKNERPKDTRPTAHQRGYTTAWRRYRDDYLSKHPFCVKCKAKGKIKEATVVDHIVPHKGDKKLFWDKKNHQPLCKHCHDVKTATEDGGFGHKRVGGSKKF